MNKGTTYYLTNPFTVGTKVYEIASDKYVGSVESTYEMPVGRGYAAVLDEMEDNVAIYIFSDELGTIYRLMPAPPFIPPSSSMMHLPSDTSLVITTYKKDSPIHRGNRVFQYPGRQFFGIIDEINPSSTLEGRMLAWCKRLPDSKYKNGQLVTSWELDEGKIRVGRRDHK